MKTISKNNDNFDPRVIETLVWSSLWEPSLWLKCMCKGPEVRVRHPAWEEHEPFGPRLVKQAPASMPIICLPFPISPGHKFWSINLSVPNAKLDPTKTPLAEANTWADPRQNAGPGSGRPGQASYCKESLTWGSFTSGSRVQIQQGLA